VGVSKGEINDLPTYYDYIAEWSLRTTFSSWADGASNQLIFGEKYIPIEYLKRNYYVGLGGWDDSWMAASDLSPFQVGRTIHASSVDPNNRTKQIALARHRGVGSGSSGDVTNANIIIPWTTAVTAVNEYGELDARFITTTPNTIVTLDFSTDQGVNGFAFRFGSEHPSTINFAIGDGSVRGINTSADTATLSNLSDIDDGNPVTIP
jgi:hypothetical protein